MRLADEEVRRRKLLVIEQCKDHFEMKVDDPCSCDTCFQADMCPFAFDPYNWGDPDDFCLADK